MGTMIKRRFVCLDTLTRPHSLLMCIAALCVWFAIMFPHYQQYAGGVGIFSCICFLGAVGANCSKVVSHLERMNLLFLLIIFTKVALP